MLSGTARAPRLSQDSRSVRLLHDLNCLLHLQICAKLASLSTAREQKVSSQGRGSASAMLCPTMVPTVSATANQQMTQTARRCDQVTAPTNAGKIVTYAWARRGTFSVAVSGTKGLANNAGC